MVELCAFKENKSCFYEGQFMTGSGFIWFWWCNERKSGGKNLDYQSEFTDGTVLVLLPLCHQEFCVFTFLILLLFREETHLWRRSRGCPASLRGRGAVLCVSECPVSACRGACFSTSLTSVSPLVSFSALKMAKAECPSRRYSKINGRHKVIQLWSCEWLLFALEYDDLFTQCSRLKISLTMLEDCLCEEPKKFIKTH